MQSLHTRVKAALSHEPARDARPVSLQVGVRVEEENMSTGARAHCCSAYLTFVAVSADGSGVCKNHHLLSAPCQLA